MARGGSKPGSARGKSSKQQTGVNQRKPGAEASTPQSSQSRISKEVQQRCLNVFCDAFRPGKDDTEILQEVKGHLFNRDFASAFSKEDYLRVYASRWSPSRALGYLQIFDDIASHLQSEESSARTDGEEGSFHVVCLGGGAGSELIALAGLRSILNETPSNGSYSFLINLVDIADWSRVIHVLQDGIITPPELSQYASQARKDANKALLQPDDISVTFEQLDVLIQSHSSIMRLFGGLDLVTVMFTLNELYSTSMAKTQQLLSRITDNVRTGCHLLIVDSPGSYSTISLNEAEKKYPMQWLMDYTLLGPPRQDATPVKWEKIMSDDSRWFRLPEGLQYPIELENMRYQIHLYRRLAESGN